MLSFNEILPQEIIAGYDDIIPINATCECKPILVVNRNNTIVYSNQSAQIAFGLNNISTISSLQTDVNFSALLTDFSESSYSNISISIHIKNLSESSFGEYDAEIEKIELDNTQYLFIVFHHTAKEMILENRINSIHAAIEFANLPVMTIDASGKIAFLSKSMENILG